MVNYKTHVSLSKKGGKMKKILLAISICLFLVACGKNYKIYTREEKKEMYTEALKEEKNGNKEKMDYIDDLMKKLEIATKKGDTTARIELGEWIDQKRGYHSYTDEVKDLKAGLNDLKW